MREKKQDNKTRNYNKNKAKKNKINKVKNHSIK